jgi:hypothetical protein
MNTPIDTKRILDAFLAPEEDRLADRVIEAALTDVARTPQRRALRAPRRFVRMPAFSVATIIAAIALVATISAGGLIFLDSTSPGASGGPTTGPVVTPARTTGPTAAVSPGPSDVAPGISGWTTYTSEVHGLTVGYPEDWSVHAPATRLWQSGDTIDLDEWPYADTFISPEQDPVGLFVWEMPAGEGAEGEGPTGVESVTGLRAWAQRFCGEVGASSCEEFTQRAMPMCLNAGGDSCRAAILVPTPDQQYAFFVDWGSAMFVVTPDRVTVVVVAREDGFPAAVRYGGSVELLKAVLTTMDVWTPGQQPSE